MSATALTIAPIPATAQYDRRNEYEYREQITRELVNKYDKRGNIIIPYGFHLGFTGSDGSEAVFEFDAGVLGIAIDGTTVFTVATDAALLALESAYEAADATLQANITSEATTRASADTAIAATVTTLTATVATNLTTALAAVTTEATARATADSAEATTRQSADATLQTNINTVSASVTTETAARVSADSALATRTTALEASVDTPTTGLLARVTVTESTNATQTSAISSIQTEISAARDGETTLLAKIDAIEAAYVSGDTAVAATVTSLTTTVTGKVTTFRQNSAPTATAIGDMWVDADDNNKLYRATATGTGSWVAVDDGRIATLISDLDTAEATIITTTGNVTSLSSTVSTLSGTVSTLSTTVSSHTTSISTNTTDIATKARTFRQTSAPTATAVGDLWIDSDDGEKLYRATATGSGSWVAVDDARIASTAATVSTLSSTVTTIDSAVASLTTTVSAHTTTLTNRNRTFRQTSAPTADNTGDLWIDSDDDEKLYRWSGSAWVAVPDARISVNATAIATVDGKLSASYGVTVDGGGRIASLKLLSNGSTSTISFTASTFKIYDDSSTDVSPFEVSGGVVKIKTANIGNIVADTITSGTLNVDRINAGTIVTAKLEANAVTTADDDETDAGQNVGSSWVSVASLDLTTIAADTRCMVMFSAYIESSGDGSLMEAQIKRGSTVVWGPKSVAGDPPSFSETFNDEGLIEYTPLFNGMISFFDTDVPGSAATFTYSVELRVSGSVTTPWVASYRRMFGIAFKR